MCYSNIINIEISLIRPEILIKRLCRDKHRRYIFIMSRAFAWDKANSISTYLTGTLMQITHLVYIEIHVNFATMDKRLQKKCNGAREKLLMTTNV